MALAHCAAAMTGFRFDNKDGRGTWICNHCGAGDGPELVKRMANVDFKGAAKMVEGIVGRNKCRRCATYIAQRQQRGLSLNRMWKRAKPIALGSRCRKISARTLRSKRSIPPAKGA
jgi:putative DNA primase/helicase